MNIKHLAKGVLGILALAGLGMITGCASSPVGEEIVTTSSCGPAPLAEVREVAVEPVAEQCGTTSPLLMTTPRDRYYDPMARSFERPWPFGPYGTANWH